MKFAAAALVVALFCAPLFIGLGRTDFQNDEPIYAFAVDVMLKNGDWLTPRSIPREDYAFLEKPPLKFWIVAAAMRAGLLPQNEFGHRFFDALFGAAAFLYVFAIGLKLGGPLCGLLSVFMLFIHGPLLYEHGIRSNNMEAPLLLAYCGGIYHFYAWATAGDSRRRRLHPLAFAGFFVFGFMTKFVAALFLPLVAGIVTLAFAEWRRRFLDDWRIWLVAALLVAVLTTPWFIYQAKLHGHTFWRILVAEQVVMRMDEHLDPAHLQPWHFYFSTLHWQLERNATLPPIAIGLALLVFDTIRRRSPLGALLLCWFCVPTVAISFGSSKLYHYLFPFLPPLAIAAGYLPVGLLRTDSVFRRVVESCGDHPIVNRWVRRLHARAPRLPAIAYAVALVAYAVAVVTVVYGRFGIHLGGVTLFRNNSIARPLAVSVILFVLAGRGKLAARWTIAIACLLTLPLYVYLRTVEEVHDKDNKLGTLKACLDAGAAAAPARGVHVHTDLDTWRYIYYFRDFGWHHPGERNDSQLLPLLFDEGRQQPVLLKGSDVARVQRDVGVRLDNIARVRFADGLQLLLPGPYAACAGPGAAALRQH